MMSSVAKMQATTRAAAAVRRCIAMSSSARVTAAVGGRRVPVTWGEGVTEAEVHDALASRKFQDWADGMDAGLRLESVHLQGVDRFGANVGFVKLRATVHRADDPHQRNVPGIVLLRGHAVAILVVLHCAGQRYALLTSQARPAAGAAHMVEAVAGMIDEDRNFAGVAAKELEEEAGITVHEDDLVPLSSAAFGDAARSGVFMSPGLLDEAISLFALQRHVTPGTLDRLLAREGGLRDEGELIRLVAVPWDRVWRRVPDAKTLSALLLFEKLEQEGLIPPCRGGGGGV